MLVEQFRPRLYTSLCIILLAVLANSASAQAVYDSIPSTLPPSVHSFGPEAYAFSEFGDGLTVTASGVGRTLATVKVVMVDWACQTGHWFAIPPDPDACVTMSGTSFSQPITLNIYSVNTGVTPPQPDVKLASVTQTFNIPFRPSTDAVNCPSGQQWFNAADGKCYYGLTDVIAFDFTSGPTIILPPQVIVGIQFNTSHYGPHPLAPQACNSLPGYEGNCPYDSLNVSAQGSPATGTSLVPGGIYVNWTGPGYSCNGTGMFLEDSGACGNSAANENAGPTWAGQHPEIELDPAPLPSLSVTKTHVGTFVQGGTGEWDITVSNAALSAATSGTTTVSDTLPMGYTVNNFTGTDVSWNCSGAGTQTASCTNTSAVNGGSSFPVIKMIVNIPLNSSVVVMNTASAYGGGDPTHNSSGTAAMGSDTVTVMQTAATITIIAGNNQSTIVNTPFPINLQVLVRDAANMPIPNKPITFQAPVGGASGTFGFPCSGTTCVVLTNSLGVATAPTFTANPFIGTYGVTATDPGPTVTFTLTNLAPLITSNIPYVTKVFPNLGMGDSVIGVITTGNYSYAHQSPENKAYTEAYAKAYGDYRPNFQSVAGYDGMALIYQVVAALKGDVDGDKAMEIIKGAKIASPRGPIMIDPATRDIVQTIYIRKVEKIDGKLLNVEFDKIPDVKDPGK